MRNGLRSVACWLPRAAVTFRPELLPRAMSGPMNLLELWSVSMSVAPVTKEGQEDRAAQNWVLPPLAETLRRTGPTSPTHTLTPATAVDRPAPYTSPEQHDRPDSVGKVVGELALRV